MSDMDNGRHEETPEQKRAWLDWFERQTANYFWCLGQPDILERYAGQVVILHEHTILGSGPGSQEALEDAQQRASARGAAVPAGHDLLSVPIPTQSWIEEAMLPPHLQRQDAVLSSQHRHDARDRRGYPS